MQHDDKRQIRKLKRDIKRRGTQRVRRQLKRELVEHPEDAPFTAIDYGRNSSQTLNGLDRDATRRNKAEE